MTSDIKLTETTIALMRYSKRTLKAIDYDGIQEVLGPIYSYDMTVHDIFRIVLASWQNARTEPRLEMPFHDLESAYTQLLIAPFKINPFVKLDYVISLGEYAHIMITHMMNDLRFSRIDWMREKMFEETKI